MMNAGTDFLILNGEIVFAGDNLATVSGEENVRQQAYLRLLADLGESVFFPEYGTLLHTFLAKPYSDENARKAEAEARAALLRVGTQAGGLGWIEQVLECRLYLSKADGKKVKMLYARYLLRGDSEGRELRLALGGGDV